MKLKKWITGKNYLIKTLVTMKVVIINNQNNNVHCCKLLVINQD